VLSTRSAAGTVATMPGTIHSGHSRAGTGYTGMGVGGGRDSTFSSRQQSEESLTTTLTTVQSMAASAMLNPHPNGGNAGNAGNANQGNPGGGGAAGNAGGTAGPGQGAAAAPPPGHAHYTTYQMATANNALTDNASVLTLASSSKRRRRNSLDTNASVRALAPSSLFGASRESLPLSFLSSNMDAASTTAGIHGSTPSGPRPSAVGGLASAERASVYSSSGVVGIMNTAGSERNSYYAGKSGLDGASVRSGLLGHGKADSISGSISGIVVGGGGKTEFGKDSPLTSPKEMEEVNGQRRGSSRRNSDWVVDDGENEDDANEDEEDEPEDLHLDKETDTNGHGDTEDHVEKRIDKGKQRAEA
jgi:hypothetical protein